MTTKSNAGNAGRKDTSVPRAKELREQHTKLNPKAPRAMSKAKRTTAIKRLVSKSEGKTSGRGWMGRVR